MIAFPRRLPARRSLGLAEPRRRHDASSPPPSTSPTRRRLRWRCSISGSRWTRFFFLSRTSALRHLAFVGVSYAVVLAAMPVQRQHGDRPLDHDHGHRLRRRRPGRHPARALRPADRAPRPGRQHRPAHGPVEPPRLRAPHDRRAGAGRAQRRAAQPADRRPRPLQDRQRPLRPRPGRRGAPAVQRARARDRAPVRRVGADRRRGVRDDPAGDRPAPGLRARRADPPPGARDADRPGPGHVDQLRRRLGAGARQHARGARPPCRPRAVRRQAPRAATARSSTTPRST